MSLFERIRKGCLELTGRFSPTLDLYILRIFLGIYVVNLLSFCLIFVLIRALRGHYIQLDHRGVELIGLYWHFVDLVWIVIFTIVYLVETPPVTT